MTHCSLQTVTLHDIVSTFVRIYYDTLEHLLVFDVRKQFLVVSLTKSAVQSVSRDKKLICLLWWRVTVMNSIHVRSTNSELYGTPEI